MACRSLVWYLIITMLSIAFAPPGHTSYLGSQPTTPSAGSDNGRHLQAALERKVLVARLQGMGFELDEVNKRLSGMSDSDIHYIVTRVEELKVAGTAEGLIIGVVVILLFVGVVLPLLGVRVWR
jgi:hypothetical protein